MRGTNYTVGFGITFFFLLGGIGMYLVGAERLIEFPGGDAAQEIGGVYDTFKLIGLIWAGVALFLLVFFTFLLMRQRRRGHLARTGTRGTVTVRSADQTGTYVNYNPVMKITGDLRASGVPERSVSVKSIVPMTALGRWGLGTDLPVSVDPNDPDDFEILWDSLPPPLAQAAPQPVAASPNGGEQSVEERLATLQGLLAAGTVTQAEYDEKRREIIEDL